MFYRLTFISHKCRVATVLHTLIITYTVIALPRSRDASQTTLFPDERVDLPVDSDKMDGMAR